MKPQIVSVRLSLLLKREHTGRLSRDRMVAAGKNANCNSQPRARQKRTESGLRRKTVQDKFF
jgi:hypothetical protein